jgi:hypothetical protein
MALQVIGAGFGRTGTLSLKAALEILGFSPCYHMTEVFANPDHIAVWDDALNDKPVNWQDFLRDYQAAVDWPVCHFWRELRAAFPQAKFLLTERDPESWYRSFSQTIQAVVQRAPAGVDDPMRLAHGRMVRRLITDLTLGGNFEKDHVIAVYKAHNEAVKRAFGKDLLVYDVKQGWAPLCAYLGMPVPAAEFPRTNSTEEFRARIAPMAEGKP